MNRSLAGCCCPILLLVCVIVPAAARAQASAPDWHQEPFTMKVGGKPLDTASRELGGYFPVGGPDVPDSLGHAAPFLADVDGDGRRDLLVGSFSGRFRLYRNVGTDSSPAFAAEFRWVMAGDNPASVPIYCCVASGPQLVDIDNDGVPDLTSGSYDPGAIYWFKGLGQGRFNQRHMLTEFNGAPVLPVRNMSNIAWTDWDADGAQDMVIGSMDGQVFLRFGRAGGADMSTYTPLPSQPAFNARRTRNGGIDELLIEGKRAIEEGHSAPGIADWDGDGLWDILLGTSTGAVYWLPNSGKQGAPEFKSRVRLLPPGEGVGQWVEPAQQPRRGIRSQIHAVDYNLDGKLDLLVGDWSQTITPRTGLSRSERKQLQEIRTRLTALDKEVGYDGVEARRHSRSYIGADKALLKQADSLSAQMAPYLELYGRSPARSGGSVFQSHGHVWVFLSK